MNPATMIILNQFLLGAIVALCAVAGVFFLRFYLRARDRLLLIFGVAFLLLGLNWMALAFIERNEVRTWLYAIRLGAFLLILIGILDKNRTNRRG
jgi:hypothetical protein